MSYARSKVCRITKVPRSSLYYRLNHPKTPGYTEEERESVIEMFLFHHRSFGRRVLHRELKKTGKDISEHKIAKILSDNECVAKYGRKKTKNVHTHGGCSEKYISENVYWNTSADERPAKVWSTDFTEQKIKGKTIYTCGIISVNGKTLVGRVSGTKNNSDTACEALKAAIKRYGAPDMIMTDRGSPYVSKSFHDLLGEHKIIHSMSRPHTPRDNRYIETFWRMMKTEIGPVKSFTEEEYYMILDYYEHYYNDLRPHSALNYLPPSVASATATA